VNENNLRAVSSYFNSLFRWFLAVAMDL